MADTDWTRVGMEAGASVFSGLLGLIAGAWHYGRRGAKHEQKVKDDYDGKILALRDDVRRDMISLEKSVEEGRDELASQFQDSFVGLGQKITDLQLEMGRDFVRGSSFDDFRKEYREDMRRLMDKVDRIHG